LAEKKAEKDRIEKEKTELEERKRIEVENKKLKKEAEKREKEIAIQKAKEETERKEEGFRLEKIQSELNKGDSDKVSDLRTDLSFLKTKYSFKSAKNSKMYSDVNLLIDKIINHIESKRGAQNGIK
jgi:hypothetical protein